MSNNISRTLFHSAVSLILVFIFTGGDCLTDNNPYSKIEGPQNVRIILDAEAQGDAYSIVTWKASVDENDPDFNGYYVGTYELNAANQPFALFNENTTMTDTFMFVQNIERGKKYISYVKALSKEKRDSDSIASKIYSGVYADTSQTISNFTSSNAFGWNVTNGTDSTYALNITNSQFIDLVLIVQGSNLNFISPNQFPPGSRVTRMEVIGEGLSAYDDTDLTEPFLLAPTLVEENKVYLLKIERAETQTFYYAKIWVHDITVSSGLPAEVRVTFDCKLQSVAGLLVL
ncbi:MAG: hypothetical protein IPM56_12700 [Ignavibacteriales bacterium]|nr:MAG: hypothetical protein IPM56_12700 [Ignavibacteriales bacterium]